MRAAWGRRAYHEDGAAGPGWPFFRTPGATSLLQAQACEGFLVRPWPISTPAVQASRIVHSSHRPGEIETIVPTPPERRPRHRESKELAKGHTDSRRQSRAETPGLPGPRTFLSGQVSLGAVLGQPGQDDQGARQRQRCLGPARTMGQHPPGLGCGSVPFSLVPHVVPRVSKFEDPCPQ